MIVFQHINKDFLPVLNAVKDNNNAYCQKWGVRYLTIDTSYIPEHYHKNRIYWERFFILQKLMVQKDDWVFYLDADAAFINHDIDIKQIPLLAPEESKFLACCTPWDKRNMNWDINTGIFFIKNDVKGKEMIDELAKYCHSTRGSFVDQDYIQNRIRQDPNGYGRLFAVFPHSAFNHNGNFIYHACEVSTCRDSVEMSVAYKVKALNDKIEAKRLEK
jgi:hypothetical protein